MAKTAKDIQGDIVALLKGSVLGQAISGDVYRKGYRPRNSRLEDAVVIFTAGLPSQVQTGVVTVHVYVPDIDLGGVFVENGHRTAVLERLAQGWVENSLSCRASGYKFTLQATITTEPDTEIQQHFVVVMLRYEYFGDDANIPFPVTQQQQVINP